MAVGDLDAFVRRHGEALVRAVVAVTGVRRPDAEDAVHDALVRAIQRGLATDDAGTFRWLRHVACNRARDMLRADRTRAAQAPPDAAAEDADPVELLVRRHRERTVRAALRTLPAHYRDVLVRRHVEGQPPRVIAAELGLPVTAVKSRLQRAAAELARACARAGLGLAAAFRGLRARGRRVLAVAPALVLAVLLLVDAAVRPGPRPLPGPGTPAPLPGAAVEVARVTAPGPASGGADVPVAATRRPAAPPPAGPALPVGNGTTTGESWGGCTFAGAPATPGVTPLIAAVDAGRYACHVEAASATCRIGSPAADGACSWTLRGDVAGAAKGVAAPVRLCDPKSGRGTLEIAFPGSGRYVVPVGLFLNDDGILVNASLAVVDRDVSVSLQFPYLCASGNPRAPLVAGQVTVRA
ncbi:MAG TPA: sigma-70 family RNA polymerase sigma factor [Mycobacteriales bacterium]